MLDIFREPYSRKWINDALTIWLLIKKHLPRLIAAMVCSLLLSSINGAIAWLAKPSIDNLFVMKNREYIVLVPLGLFILFTLRGLFTFANNFLMYSIGAKIVKFIRKIFYEKMMFLPLSFYTNESSGSAISRLTNDITILESLAANTAKNFFVQSATVIILASIALYRNVSLALLAFTVIPLIAFVAAKFGKKMKQTSMKTRKLISNVTRIIHEALSSIRVIKSFTLEEEMMRRNEQAISAHYRNIMREVRINEFTGAFIEIIAGIGIGLLSWYGFSLVVTDRLTIGEFISFVIAVMMMYDPLKRLSRVNNDFQTIRAVLHRLREVSSLENERSGTIEKDRISGKVVLNNVSFKYPEHTNLVLKDISLTINPGERLAIVGYSGAGKSTLTDLILGFWDNYSGTIAIDDINLRDYSLRNLRSHIGVVSQDIVLFDDTVRNNILAGNPTADGEDVIKAAMAAYAHEFIMDMPGGYEAQIGEQGVKLSGGQKQRISLARAILKNPQILILDEATSSLDTDSETKIQKALEGIMPGRTTVIIAHRLSTIQKADRIIVMDRGRIIQEGRHDELFGSDGIYRDLYTMQFGLTKH